MWEKIFISYSSKDRKSAEEIHRQLKGTGFEVWRDQTRIETDWSKRLEDDIIKLQSGETDKWCAEFNSSLAMLNDLIKSQRASAENAAEITRAALTGQDRARET